jgi:hypothetical protein
VFLLTFLTVGLGYLLYPWVVNIIDRSRINVSSELLYFSNPSITDSYISVEARNVGGLTINITRIMVNDSDYPLSHSIKIQPYSAHLIYIYGNYLRGVTYRVRIDYSTGYSYVFEITYQ